MRLLLYAIPFFIITIPLEWWIVRRRDGSSYSIPDAITSLHFGLLSQISASISKVFLVGLYSLIYELCHVSLLETHRPSAWILALFIYDFLYYWAHRFGHQLRFMWAAHQVHHSSEYLNFTTALRTTATDVFFIWPFYIPMAVMGVPPQMYATLAMIDLLYQYWVHTEMIGKLRWFDKIFVSPSNHRVHHGQNDYCIDKNFGGILIIWDRLFGTFAEERSDEKIYYGIRNPLRSFNPIWGNVKAYVDLVRATKQARGWREKLAAWFTVSENSTKEHSSFYDFSERTHPRFKPDSSIAIQIYSIVHYVLSAAFTAHFMVISSNLSWLSSIAYALLILTAIVSISSLLNGNEFARRAEQIRVCVYALCFGWAPLWFGWRSPWVAKVLLLILALASVLWLQRVSKKPTAEI